MPDGGDDPTLGEVARVVHRLEQALSEFRSEMRTMVEARVSKEAHAAGMEVVHSELRALSERTTKAEARVDSIEDERDRTRLAITVALLTALAAPIVVALLLGGGAR